MSEPIWTVDLTPAEYGATAEKIRKLNQRAEKRGWTGHLTLTGKEVSVTETGPSGLAVTKQFMRTSLTGKMPVYDGYTFVAKLEWDQDSGLVVFSAPGAPKVDRSKLREGECDHCGINRYRRNVYLVSDQKGKMLQVGSTCLKDFLGWDANPVWINPPTAESLFESGGFGYVEPTYSTETVLAAAWAVIQKHGYVSASAYSGTPTKYAVATVLDPHGDREREFSRSILPYVDEAYGKARMIREWVLNELKGDSDYAINLRNIARGDFVRMKNFGFLVSAPQTWAKSIERDLVRRQEQEELLNEWVGQPKERLELTVTVKSERMIESDWGVTTLYTFVDDSGHVFKWFSSRSIWYHGLPTEPVKIKGTIKKHEEYRGAKSTVLTRVKVID